MERNKFLTNWIRTEVLQKGTRKDATFLLDFQECLNVPKERLMSSKM
jgi:hypothetical protein